MKLDIIEQLDALPESKLELIGGKLIIGSLAGSKRMAWQLLQDYGPAIGLPFASKHLWWQAIHYAFDIPSSVKRTPEEWWQWANSFELNLEPDYAGPHQTAEHNRVYQLLKMGLYHFAQATNLGLSLGRDFVVRLNKDALTPDQIFVDQSRMSRLNEYYLDGPPAIVIEITQPGSLEQDRELKFLLCERALVPEYWLIDPHNRKADFWRRDPDGRYCKIPVGADGVYRSAEVPDLALSLSDLFSMDGPDIQQPCHPFLNCARKEAKSIYEKQAEGIGWNSVSFAPRIELFPSSIKFEEFMSWCGEAKIERYQGGFKIGGPEATNNVFALLLMTFGMAEIVRLAPPPEWVIFLAPELFEDEIKVRAQQLLARTSIEKCSDIGTEIFYHGSIAGLDNISVYCDTEQMCQEELEQSVENWIKLCIARGNHH